MSKASDRLTIRLGNLRDDWAELCQSRGLSEAEGVRILISNALGSQPGTPQLQAPEGKKARIEIRVSVQELQAIKVVADKSGFTLNRWIVALIASQTKRQPHFGERELEAVAESNYQLSAIGRNLNMLTRDLKANPETIEPYRFTVLENLKKQIDDHLKTVHQLIQANLDRWKRPGR